MEKYQIWRVGGDYISFSLYYEEDWQIVLNQPSINSQAVACAGLVNYNFYNNKL
ncbi:MAG: hypothetical protein ACI9XB_005286 [Gammaproteobacteria bacterium]|jgi:hypothetical protein